MDTKRWEFHKIAVVGVFILLVVVFLQLAREDPNPAIAYRMKLAAAVFGCWTVFLVSLFGVRVRPIPIRWAIGRIVALGVSLGLTYLLVCTF